MPAELSPLLRVAEPQQREPRVPEQLRHEPAACEERDRLPERCSDAREPHQPEHRTELEEAERQRGPPRLVRQQAVVGLEVERDRDSEHEPNRLDGPPAVLGEREHARGDDDRQERGEPRLEASSQRVRHAWILRRNAWPT